MTHDDIDQELDLLEQKIQDAATGTRHEFAPELHRLIAAVKAAGHPVNQRLLDLDKELIEDAIEAQFDNLPV